MATIERRRVTRMPAYMAARIIFNDRFSTMDCLVRNWSDMGAALELETSATLPDRFTLEVPKRDRRYDARLIWRNRTRIGIEIETTVDAVVPLDMARRLRSALDENAALKQRLSQLGN